MAADHYVVLGLARVRAPWFRDLGRWATAGMVPIDFVKCVSVEEVRARLDAGRAYSALVVDGGLSQLDRDLCDLARSQGCAVIVVDDGHARRDWIELGASAVLPEPLAPAPLAQVLVEHAHPVHRIETTLEPAAPPSSDAGWRGRLVAVTGTHGSGTSLMAMALAQGVAGDARHAGRVLLADLALHADQALLHHAGDVVPGVQELVDAHRGGRPSSDEVRALTFDCPERGYRLLLGLRRHRDWASLRPRAFEAALDSLRQAFKVVIADIDADVEGEAECGSLDVEDRNLLARTVSCRADVVVVTATATVAGLRRLVTIIDDLTRLGVDPARLLPVVTRAPRGGRARAEMSRAVAELSGLGAAGAGGLAAPLFVPDRRQLDGIVRDAEPLPAAIVVAVTAAVEAVGERIDPARAHARPERVPPGSLGSWSPDAAAG